MPGNATRAGPLAEEVPARHDQHPTKDTEPSLSKVARDIAPGLDAALRYAAAGTAFTRLIEALERHGQRVTGNGRQRSAQCPAHEDRSPSLSVTDGESRVLVRCHAGCDTDDVLATLGLTRADLFNEAQQRRSGEDDWAPWQRDRCDCKPVARYSYVDENGELLFQVVRGEHKEFSQRCPDPSSRSGWRWSLGGTRRILYHLPQLLAAPDSACIFVAEGEKDVHALEAAGEVATCPPMGAGKWRPEYAEALTGRDVLIVADRDEPGRDHAWDVLTSIRPVARFAWIVQATAGKDAADHLGAGFGVHDFTWWNL